MPYTGLSGFTDLPIKVATGLYTTSIGGFGYLSCQDWTGRTYAGIGINEASLKKRE